MGNYAEEDIDSSEIECPNCGERVYAEVLVCPKCGLHFYPDSDTDEYLDLLARVRHDTVTAERLIEYERRRSNPTASRSKLIRNAIDRFDQDRRLNE